MDHASIASERMNKPPPGALFAYTPALNLCENSRPQFTFANLRTLSHPTPGMRCPASVYLVRHRVEITPAELYMLTDKSEDLKDTW